MDEEQMEEKTLNEFELGNELYALVESNVIPAFIADKIKDKLNENKIKLSKTQLYELVDIIKKEVQTQDYSYNGNQEKEITTPAENIDYMKDDDIEKVFKAIETLGNRLKKIEEGKIEYQGDSEWIEQWQLVDVVEVNT